MLVFTLMFALPTSSSPSATTSTATIGGGGGGGPPPPPPPPPPPIIINNAAAVDYDYNNNHRLFQQTTPRMSRNFRAVTRADHPRCRRLRKTLASANFWQISGPLSTFDKEFCGLFGAISQPHLHHLAAKSVPYSALAFRTSFEYGIRSVCLKHQLSKKCSFCLIAFVFFSRHFSPYRKRKEGRFAMEYPDLGVGAAVERFSKELEKGNGLGTLLIPAIS
ncbi:hypothetical protein PoB_001624800 [Plakobranchus ocellatus]|uniref:Uncharacterized protein n=1 Tax=Plakobranchus ocellatus TaxID=259542 RepID=A0AAV3Z509_9GAST|nr:hypothetical protein PoB_001624800 [Plakobranchus ocellatus]